MEYADQLEAESADSGFCPICHEHLDGGRCECPEEERENAPDPEEEAGHDRGERMYQESFDE